MNDFQQKIYNNLLLSIVFNLKDFKRKSGQEGTVYFIDDNFVVKEIFGEQIGFFTYDNFENYCKELIEFNKQGAPIPKIYSWTMLPKNMFEPQGGLNFDRYYILEERVKGKELFASYLLGTFEDCKDFCSKEEFNSAILTKEGTLYKKIVENYLKYFLKTNQQLESLPINVIENFILSDYLMMKNQKFGANDMHNSNVMFDGSKLTMIDNSFVENFFASFSDEKLRTIVMQDMLRILSENEKGLFCGAIHQKKWASINPLYLEHKKILSAVVQKFIKTTNAVLQPVFQDDIEYINSKSFIKSIAASEKEEKSFIELLEKKF